MSRIFISHSSADARETVALKQWLASQDPPLANEIFVDQDRLTGIQVGNRWKDELKRASSRCEAVVCLLSANWESSDYCRSEFGAAEILGKKIICARLEPTAGASITREWQRCDLFGDGPKTPVDIKDGEPPVAFATEGLERLKLAICENGISAESFVWPPNPEPGRAPYRGADFYDEVDAGVFFGRDALIVTGLDALRLMRAHTDEPEHLFVVKGPSGSGKSSYLRAGLLPRLRREDRRFLVLDTVCPKRDAITGTAGLAHAIFATRKRFDLTQPDVGAIKKACQNDSGRVRELLVECQQSAVNRFIDRDEDVHLPTVVLPVDQADELFDTHATTEAAQLLQLIRDLAAPGDADALGLIVIATIRADRYQHMQTAPILDGIKTHPFGDLKPVPITSFKDVITCPAKRSTDSDHKFKVDAELVERLLEDSNRGGGELVSMLSLTLAQLYQDYSADGVLTLGEYDELGRLSDVVTAEVARVLATDEEQRIAQLKLLRAAFIPWLVTVNDADQPMRRRARWTDLPKASRPMIGEFVENRLMSTDVDGDQPVVEVVSESLLTEWDDLKGWLADESESLRRADALERSAADWRDNDRRTEYLLPGQRLEEAEKLAKDDTYGPRLRGVHDFLAASRKHENDELAKEIQKEQTHSQRLRKALGVVAAALVIALVCGGIAVGMKFKADDARDAADQARQEAVAQYHQAVSQRLVSQAQAALTGARPDGDTRAFQQLLAARTLTEEPDDDAVFSAAIVRMNTLKIMQAPPVVSRVAISPDGRFAACASTKDNNVQIWDTETGKPIGTNQPSTADALQSVAFSRDGKLVATGGSDGTVRVWNAETAQQVGRQLGGRNGAVLDVAFSPDGRTIASAGADGTVREWDVKQAIEIVPTMQGHLIPVRSVTYSPDGKTILSGGDDQTIRRWNAATGAPAGPALTRQAGTIWSVAYSPDGLRIVSAASDRTLQQWDASSGAPIGQPIRAHFGEAFSAEYAVDGRRIVSGGDSSVRVWNAQTGEPIGPPLTGHTNIVMSVAVSAQGDKVVSGSTDNTVRIWDIRNIQPTQNPVVAVNSVALNSDGDRIVVARDDNSLQLLDGETLRPVAPLMTGHTRPVMSVAFSRDGSRIASGSADGTIRIWDGRSGLPIGAPLTGPSDRVFVYSVAFSPDGKRVVSGSDDGTMRVWDVDTGTPSFVREGADEGHNGPDVTRKPEVLAVAYSPTDNVIVTGGRDRTLHVWDADSGAPVGPPMSGHQGSINSIQFTSDGKRVVTASNDATIRVWDIDKREQIGSHFFGHQGNVTSVAISADDKRIVSGGVDYSVRMWHTDTGQPIGHPMRGHQDIVGSVAFSADGKTVVSVSKDSTLRVWPAVVGPEALCAKLTSNMSEKHWREWVGPDITYVKVCDNLDVAPDD